MADSISELNQKVMAALVKKYGSKAAAEEAFRTLDGGELMRIKEEMGYAKGGRILRNSLSPAARSKTRHVKGRYSNGNR